MHQWLTGAVMTAVDLGAYDALDDVATGSAVAAAAFVTWLIGHSHGWDVARCRVPRSTYYRHLSLIRSARLAGPKSPRLPSTRTGVAEAFSGGALLRIVGKRFRLVADFDEFARRRQRGTVQQILFRNGEWIVGVQFDGSPGAYVELCVRCFALIAQWVGEHE